ncbi:MAG: nitrilase-related carbon-nitrogen hydrolase [Planctomycetota bacterium]
MSSDRLSPRAAAALYALSGALVSLSFPPYGHAWIAWVGLTPAFYALARGSHGAALLGGLLFAAVEEAFLLRWFFSVFAEFAFVPLAVYAAWYVVLFGLASRVLKQLGPSALLWTTPVMWVAVEFVRSELFVLKFAWFGLGYSQSANLPVLQAASVVGVYGLSFGIAFANAAIAWVADRFTATRFVTGLAVASAVSLAHVAGSSVPQAVPGDFQVVGIQGEGLPMDKFLESSVEGLRQVSQARLVVWPEYSLSRKIDLTSPEVERVRAFAAEWQVPVLFGAPCATNPPRRLEFENTVLLVGPEGVRGTQVKSEPIPFMADGRRAEDRMPLSVGGARVGAAICYDMDFPYVTRELVVEGAQLLVYPTMDAEPWGETEHVQHAAMTPLRAVEHRRWVVRVASSGISQVVDPYGRVRQTTPIGKPAILPAEVALLGGLTPYARFGWLLPHVCLGVAVLLLILAARRERAARRR